LLITDDDYRNELIIKGHENIKRFEATSISNEYYQLYKRINSYSKSAKT